MQPSDPRTIRELLDALANTPLGAETRDPEKYRQRVYRELAEHDDPLLREIGEQLSDGVIQPHQLLSIPGYSEVVEQGLEQLSQIDSEQVRAVLADYVDSAAQQRDQDR